MSPQTLIVSSKLRVTNMVPIKKSVEHKTKPKLVLGERDSWQGRRELAGAGRKWERGRGVKNM